MQKPIETTKFSEWYLNAIQEAALFDYSPVRGCAVIRPNGYKIWECIQKNLDGEFKKIDVENAYFPLFIPESFLNKEKKHIEGFSPELAVVTHAGGSELEEPLVVRPTSETIIYYMFSKWIKSHRDLPLKINQWANVVRWEMRTRPFLRTTEFLWQEGHTAHENEEEAFEFAKTILNLYSTFLKEVLAIPHLTGAKPESEKFAGAKATLTLEPMMGDGKALQVGTSHLLENSFPEAFEVFFQDSEGKNRSPWCTSWGMTTRLIGAVIMTHGNPIEGLVLPARIAPIQIAIVPIRKKTDDQSVLNQFIDQITMLLKNAGIRVKLFDGESSPGARFFETEKLAVPLRLEIGMRDAQANQVFVSPRLSFGEYKKQGVAFDNLLAFWTKFENDFHNYLFSRAEQLMNDNFKEIDTLSELEKEFEAGLGFFKAAWCLSSECEAKLKPLGASFRVMINKHFIHGEDNREKRCFACGKNVTTKAIIAKAY